jgi:hypothetical protein
LSYDVFLQRFQHGNAAAVESLDVWRLLEEAWDSPPDELNYCRVRRDGDEGDLYAVPRDQPIDSLMFSRAGRLIYHLMFEVAVAGDMTIIPPGAGPFLVRAAQVDHLPADLVSQAVVVGSGPELVRAIEES